MAQPSLSHDAPERPAPARRVRRLVAALLLVVSGACDNGTEVPATPPRPQGPHVVLIVMETTRADRCSIAPVGGWLVPQP